MDDVFRKLDRTTSLIGSQYLYGLMRSSVAETGTLENRLAAIKNLGDSAEGDERYHAALISLKNVLVSPLTRLLLERRALVEINKRYVYGWSLLPIIGLSIGMAFGVKALFGITLILILINFIASRLFEQLVESDNSDLYHVLQLVSGAKILREALGNKKYLDSETALPELSDITAMRRKLFALSLNQGHPNLMVSNAAYLLNLFFNYDALLYCIFRGYIQKRIPLLASCLHMVGKSDAYISVARYLKNTSYCRPSITTRPTLEFEACVHPLIEKCVPNSLSLSSKSALLTGSNMSGKSTLLRTIGVNFVLGRSLFFCHAKSAVLPAGEVMTSINRTDVMSESTSLYMAELLRLKEILEASFKSDSASIFLIDEIYRGTNTVERIASSSAVLRQLSSQSVCLVTTHDVELSELLNDSYQLWHFAETGDVERPFDFKLKAGLNSERNAIKLMERVGYPAIIVDEARALANLSGKA
ncbi:MAG: hypothetical protein HRU21_12435 [Pseudomonadales bacterium]|nr:hypothetical protein [Pseudomonadales bacterium]